MDLRVLPEQLAHIAQGLAQFGLGTLGTHAQAHRSRSRCAAHQERLRRRDRDLPAAQGPHQAVHLPALGNVQPRAQCMGMLTAQIVTGLGSKFDHYPSQLSGGQQQRVAIARALAMRPKVMLFDEVTSALDPELCGEVLNVIRRLGSEHNLTMLMVTHQMGFAREFADRVCFFYKGQIHEQGTPAQIYENPQQERTRAFLSAVREAN